MSIHQHTKQRIYMAHDWILRAAEAISAEQFSRVFSPQAPPIGWHLWHIARFVDPLQCKLNHPLDQTETNEIWYQQGLSAEWGLEPADLGVFESGMGQAHEVAQTCIRIAGQANLVAYGQTSFQASRQVIDRLTEADFERRFFGLFDYRYDRSTGKVWQGNPVESEVAADLVFHANHASRHMGMMEALTGLLGQAGTLSV